MKHCDSKKKLADKKSDEFYTNALISVLVGLCEDDITKQIE